MDTSLLIFIIGSLCIAVLYYLTRKAQAQNDSIDSVYTKPVEITVGQSLVSSFEPVIEEQITPPPSAKLENNSFLPGMKLINSSWPFPNDEQVSLVVSKPKPAPVKPALVKKAAPVKPAPVKPAPVKPAPVKKAAPVKPKQKHKKKASNAKLEHRIESTQQAAMQKRKKTNT